MFHRLRECTNDPTPGPLGGQTKVVEADESYIGGKARNKAYGAPPKKMAVFSLVAREGKVRSRHVAEVTAKTLRKAIVTQVDRKSYLMTDEAPAYTKTGTEFSGHGTVNHSIDQYTRQLNSVSLSNSSRRRPLKLSTKPFCIGLPGAM
jgi:ISXO2-like transposase domain